MDALIIFGAKYLVYVALALWVLFVAFYLYRTKRYWFISKVVASGALAFIFSRIIHTFFYNPRPFVSEHITPLIQHAADNGFPSDHVLLLATLGFVIFSISRRWAAGILVLGLLVGFARVAAGVHHLVDIAGSFVIALFAVFLVNLAFRTLAHRRREKRVLEHVQKEA